jgi:type IV pilus assembly protein PilV
MLSAAMPAAGRDFSSARRAQAGSSLLEVLVSITVVGTGLLGVAGLQATSLRATADAGHQAVAARLGYDIGERLRQDPAALANYLSQASEDQRGESSAACFDGEGCTGDERVVAGLAEWQRALSDQLPDGQGLVCRDATPNDGSAAAGECSGNAADPVVVKIWWRARALDRRAEGDGVQTMRFSAVIGL